MTSNLMSQDSRHKMWFKSSERMNELEDASIDLMVTSPPYMLGLPYGNSPGQLEMVSDSFASYERYLRGLEPVWRECYRVMKPGAYAAINAIYIHTAGGKFEDTDQPVILPIPDDIARFWRSMGALNKPPYLWTTIRGRQNNAHEAMPIMGSIGLPLEGAVLREVEWIVMFRKPKGPNYKLSEERKARRKASPIDWHGPGAGEWGEIFGQMWYFPGARKETTGGITHPAPFPEELPRRIIRGYSCVDDVVLDPFAGTGTTALAAWRNGRKSVGFEVEPKFRAHIEAKCKFFGEESMAEVY